MGLAASRRAIRKDGSVVAVHDRVQEVFGGSLVDVGLGRIVIEDAIEAKRLVFHAFAGGQNGAAESLDRVVFGPRDSHANVACPVRRGESKVELWCRHRSQGAVAQEQRAIVALGELRRFPDSEGTHPDSDLDAGRAAIRSHCHPGKESRVAISSASAPAVRRAVSQCEGRCCGMRGKGSSKGEGNKGSLCKKPTPTAATTTRRPQVSISPFLPAACIGNRNLRYPLVGAINFGDINRITQREHRWVPDDTTEKYSDFTVKRLSHLCPPSARDTPPLPSTNKIKKIQKKKKKTNNKKVLSCILIRLFLLTHISPNPTPETHPTHRSRPVQTRQITSQSTPNSLFPPAPDALPSSNPPPPLPPMVKPGLAPALGTAARVLAAFDADLLSPAPDGVVEHAEGTATADAELEGFVPGGRFGLLFGGGVREEFLFAGAARLPELGHDFGEALGEVVGAHAEFAEAVDRAAEEGAAGDGVDVGGVEGVEQLEECDGAREHHLFDVPGDVEEEVVREVEDLGCEGRSKKAERRRWRAAALR
ncbi:hypothetical protein KC341_g68 [Hortaea werneckii]|nr:hypothetical protein KC341_g68 [Hortaea werneckii]